VPLRRLGNCGAVAAIIMLVGCSEGGGIATRLRPTGRIGREFPLLVAQGSGTPLEASLPNRSAESRPSAGLTPPRRDAKRVVFFPTISSAKRSRS
jgi:hypothetical protein